MESGLRVFVDTNVVLYAHDARAPEKQQRAQQWLSWCWQHNEGRISSQVLNELYANLKRVARCEPVFARQIVQRYRAWGPLAADQTTVDLAWSLEDRFGFSYWDCLMIAAAQQQGCTHLLTEDLQHGQLLDRLTVVSPFEASELV